MTREIILMRHGQPDLASVSRVSPRDMQHWIEEYERSEITDAPAPALSARLASSAHVVVSSSAPRALGSLKALGLEPDHTDALFCEAQMPHGRWPVPHLSPFTWAVVLRLLWLGGLSGDVESARQARQRAQQAALRLTALTDQGRVLLLGHGFMNRLIARHLQASGWQRHGQNGSGYWSASVYRQPALT